MTLAIEPRSATLLATPPTFVPAPNSVVRFTVDQYHQMISAGAFKDDDTPVELLEGWIVYKMGHNPPHDVVVKLVATMLDRALNDRWHTRVQSAMTTADSEPLPDVAVVAGSARDYTKRHPGPADIALLVEVSDSSLDRDRNEKAPLYARAGVAVYWIVNVQDSIVEVYSNPAGPTLTARYQKVERFDINQLVALTLGGEMLPPIPVKEILP
jgi:Uma2 family endonuclease